MEQTKAPSFAAATQLLDCVHCGLCLTACPTYLELGNEADSPRGRIHLMRGLADGTLAATADVVRHLDLCLGCRACESACPSGVRYGELIEAARSFVEEQNARGWQDRLRRKLIHRVFPRPNLLRLLLLPLRVLEVAGLLNWLRRHSRLVRQLPRFGGWTPLAAHHRAWGQARRRVAMLDGCVQQVLFAETNRATVRVLVRNGCDVNVPAGQVCCGALSLHAGDPEGARVQARRNIEAFQDESETILVNAAGCGAMLKEYGALLADDAAYAQRARAFSARVRDATEFLADLSIVPPQGAVDARVTYHEACHLAHGQGIREAPRQILRQIPGLELVELAEADVCCGSAGSYNLTEPEMAQRLGARKAANVQATRATVVAAANPGCVLQIRKSLAEAGSQVEVVHPLELLDVAYRSVGKNPVPR